ncbi:YxlC family protein [Alkalihalobacillus sp. MEB130]|uniref:YxlC family protein n=1 Tax=Alkalihalobacillus sp. MEB130 TaxID=2976704 RepID=UPI0028DF3376|nr:YxlC family protein [Alkalihalobacillus sp. MEB130]MDT8858768.1 YxlC family protein [Alkalihalobacillus sp. MEB130]
MKRSEEQEQISKLQHDWKQLDELGDRSPASVLQIKELIALQKEKQKRAFYKEVSIFFVTAILLLSVFMMSIVQAPVVFLTVQVGAIVFAPIILYVLVKRKKDEGKVLQ